MNVYEKLMEVRFKISQMDIKKSGNNKFSHFKYFELKDFLSIATKLFKEHKLYSKFSIIPANQSEQETAKFVLINIEKPEEQDVYTLPTAECFIGRKSDGSGGADPIQNLGGKITYLRRYMYLIALDLIEDDSVDNQEQSKPQYKPQPKQQNKPQNKPTTKPKKEYSNNDDMVAEGIRKGIAMLEKLFDKAGNDSGVIKSQFLKKHNWNSMKDILFKDNLEFKILMAEIKELVDTNEEMKEVGI